MKVMRNIRRDAIKKQWSGAIYATIGFILSVLESLRGMILEI
eukprot:CAMPEP_0168313614 /NCGR_PEP_ID=MMETSP0210-20121227/3137_1 /TAXON_ID=40633 /ORGANISM="Condylostoma magnum, Strain COL2" /LENGTH=41 /DNA_ID= /DNA_START= /DNA_END= /DNA_ORIENTATION=